MVKVELKEELESNHEREIRCGKSMQAVGADEVHMEMI